jgi:hypothetical protein
MSTIFTGRATAIDTGELSRHRVASPLRKALESKANVGDRSAEGQIAGARTPAVRVTSGEYLFFLIAGGLTQPPPGRERARPLGTRVEHVEKGMNECDRALGKGVAGLRKGLERSRRCMVRVVEEGNVWLTLLMVWHLIMSNSV